MDLIRTFAQAAFSKIANRYLSILDQGMTTSLVDELMFDEAMFVDECRDSYPEFTDDQLRVIYALYRDEWSFPPDETSATHENLNNANRHIFNVLFRLTEEILRVVGDVPKVKFRHLFRWRELSQLMGEDLLTCAFIAYKRKDDCLYDFGSHGAPGVVPCIRFSGWPTVLHNDNPHLEYIFRTVKLCELHSHLQASTDTFGISWIALMNHTSGRISQFKELAKIQDPSRSDILAKNIHSDVIRAAKIRHYLWTFIVSGNEMITELPDINDTEGSLAKFDQLLDAERALGNDLDYINDYPSSPMNVFAGERMLLFALFERVLRSNDILLYELFYQYILIKNKLRTFLVQVNENRGFNNFKRFQDLKSTFIRGTSYNRLLKSLPMWEARKFNFTSVFEARIAPSNSPKNFDKTRRMVEETLAVDFDNDVDTFEWSFIFHFIKIHEKQLVEGAPRDNIIRIHTSHQGKTLKTLLTSPAYRKYISGIDAASSEIACRPEAFAQVFRFLKAVGYSATFHAGEDFYDIADGLRAIFEAINFLGLDSGDRLGHVIALGIDANEFYKERHNYIALPAQWMLDNLVWLYYYGKENNVKIDPQTENFLITTSRSLLVEIGYVELFEGKIDMSDYYQSMMLRADNPEAYHNDKFSDYEYVPMDGDSWSSFSLSQDQHIRDIRQHNPNAVDLYHAYHYNMNLKKRGQQMRSFHLPEGYAAMITDLQNKMMMGISKRRLGIECCPSSNLRIGRLHSFDRHPIFRFMPVREYDSRYPLPVTVNTDDLGIFATSLPNEYSLLALALLKKRASDGSHMYSSQEVYDWIERVVANGHKFTFHARRSDPVLNYYDSINEDEQSDSML